MANRFYLPALAALCVMSASAQQPSPAPQQTAPPATASSVLSPALAQIRDALSGVRLDKWKSADAAREETNANIGSISRDLDGTLPPLLAAADAAPGSVTAVLPVFRNVDALYDVLLRVTAAADHGAPRPQQSALDSALSGLESARHTLGDLLAQAAAMQDAATQTLRTQLADAAATLKPVCPETHPAPVHRPAKRHHAESSSSGGTTTPQQ